MKFFFLDFDLCWEFIPTAECKNGYACRLGPSAKRRDQSRCEYIAMNKGSWVAKAEEIQVGSKLKQSCGLRVTRCGLRAKNMKRILSFFNA
jgi:hypothetical protein